MTENLRLEIPYKDFQYKAEQFIAQAIKLDIKTIETDEELRNYKSDINTWSNDVSTFLKTSFNIRDNQFERDFYAAYSGHFTIEGVSYSIAQQVSNQKEKLRDKHQSFLDILKILNVCDVIIKYDEINLIDRIEYTTNDKLFLLLEKLFYLYDDCAYPVEQILIGNGIILKTLTDARDLVKMLVDKDYAEMAYSDKGEVCAKLNMRGYMVVEEQLKNKPKTKNMDDEQEQVVVFISHGHSGLWKDVARFIDKKLNMETVVLKEQTNRGRSIMEKLEQEASDCNYAIIVMTAEDEQKDGELRARENVIHEIGFLQGLFGRENVLVLKQKEIKPFTNILGIVYEPFEGENIASTFERIRQELEDFEERLEEEEEYL